MSSPAARRARRSDSVWFWSATVTSTLVDCICGVWNLSSLISASTLPSGSSAAISRSNCETSCPVGFPFLSFSSMLGVKYASECSLNRALSGFSLFGVPFCRPPPFLPFPSPFCRGIANTKVKVNKQRWAVIFAEVMYVLFYRTKN